jgi:hypothetical protein
VPGTTYGWSGTSAVPPAESVAIGWAWNGAQALADFDTWCAQRDGADHVD